MTIYEINPLADSRWEDFIRNHPASSIFHTTGWLNALYRTYGCTPTVITTCAPNTPLSNGVVFCSVRSWITGKRLVSLPYSDHCEPLAATTDLEEILTYLRNQAVNSGQKYVELRPLRTPLQPGFEFSQQFRLHVLELSGGAEKVLRKTHRDCIQRKIRRAEREHLAVQSGNNLELMQDFYKLVVRTRRRQGVPPQPFSWYRNLGESMGTALEVHLASANDQPVAAILTIRHKGTIVYKYGASDERFHNLGGMPFVFWHAIQNAIASGAEKMDMGRSDADNPGLIAFKGHWGAEDTELSYWRSPAVVASRAEQAWATQLAQKVCSRMPENLLSTLGALIYRHAG